MILYGCKEQEIRWWVVLLTLTLLSLGLQLNIYIHKDIAVLTHLATVMLQGQTYGHDIFEPNLPLALYIYFLPIVFSKVTGLKIIYVLRVYVLMLIVCSVTCSRFLLRHCIKDKACVDWIMYGLACILLFLPADAFGQREHFLLILTLPYIFLATCRLEDKTIHSFVACLIGCMAGIGFAIKPYFLTTFILIELLFIVHKKLLRIEFISALLVILIYSLVVVIFYPEYWTIVVPLWSPFYQTIALPWPMLLRCMPVWFCVAVIVHWLFFSSKTHVHLKMLLILSTLGFLITFLIPKVAWYYHLLPAFSLACLYCLVIVAEIQPISWRKALLIGLMIFLMPLYYSVERMIKPLQQFHSTTAIKQFSLLLQNTTYSFLSATHTLSILEYYSSTHYLGNLMLCGWYESLPVDIRLKYQSFFLNMISRDLNEYKPDIVIVDVPKATELRFNRAIDFTKEYAKNTMFHDAWSHYRHRMTVESYDVYQREE